ncbi:ribulokinase [Puteibacter caeruleilacunae]|nr:ribulokinase [Puteibacter caeruleilacunae]
MEKILSLGIDFGSNAVRALFLNVRDGKTIASASCTYQRGNKGVFSENHHMARQHPQDYLDSMTVAITEAISKLKDQGYSAKDVQGIGVDATGSTPIPVKSDLTPLANLEAFSNNLNAYAWMWKDHTSASEADEITTKAQELRPQYLTKCGGAYSSEWFWAKLLHCARTDKSVFDEADSWLEFSDFVPAVLAGIKEVSQVKRNKCAAGHKAFYHSSWNGFPDKEFLSALDKDLVKIADTMGQQAYSIDEQAGLLSEDWATRLGLSAGIPVAVGALDAHIGALGSGVGEGTLVKIIGTSSCDIMVSPMDKNVPDIPGVAGIAEESVVPNNLGIEAGQSAVGDILNWFVSELLCKDGSAHVELTEKASALAVGQTGLLALDWNNGNRNVLTDPNLSGLLIGQSLFTKDFEIYRALIEATAFGARRIIEQMEQYGVEIEKVINCGGISQKNALFMQIYADVINKPMLIADNEEAVALGAAIFAAKGALESNGESYSLEALQEKACTVKEKIFTPIAENVDTYNKLYELYKQLHDSFGVKDQKQDLYGIMKTLIELKNSSKS